MKGRAPTADEARFMRAIVALGCVACRKEGWQNRDVSVHHIDGRTKPGAYLMSARIYWLFVALLALVTPSLAGLAYHYVEKPGIELGKRFQRRGT